MTPAARLQAAIEILDEVIASARDDGPPADAIVTRYFKTRRYAGSKDRRAVRELVFRAIRRSRERPRAGGRRCSALAVDDPALLELFGEPRGPAPVGGRRGRRTAWRSPGMARARTVAAGRRPTNGRRCWSARRSTFGSMSRGPAARHLLAEFEGAEPTPLSPWGLRLPADSRVDDIRRSRRRAGRGPGRGQPADRAGLHAAWRIDGSRPVRRGRRQGAGAGRSRSGSARSSPPTPTARGFRSSRRGPSAPERNIETRLLNPPNELAELADWSAQADLVLVDAPCSGSGTWRRNPRGAGGLRPTGSTGSSLCSRACSDIAAELVRPGGRLVYAVCSLLSREGAGQVERLP